MREIGIFFGTRSGTTRLMAKKLARLLAAELGKEAVAKPLNINRTDLEAFKGFKKLILGTPTYGEGVLPGLEHGDQEESWADILPKLEGADFSGCQVALYGLGDQEAHPAHFADGMGDLAAFFKGAGAELVGAWPAADYEFKASRALDGDQFVGLVVDTACQGLKTDDRLADWSAQLVKEFSS